MALLTNREHLINYVGKLSKWKFSPTDINKTITSTLNFLKKICIKYAAQNGFSMKNANVALAIIRKWFRTKTSSISFKKSLAFLQRPFDQFIVHLYFTGIRGSLCKYTSDLFKLADVSLSQIMNAGMGASSSSLIPIP